MCAHLSHFIEQGASRRQDCLGILQTRGEQLGNDILRLGQDRLLGVDRRAVNDCSEWESDSRVTASRHACRQNVHLQRC